MASLRKLNRRLTRWERYAARYRRPGTGDVARTGRGGARIWKAIQRERERRQCFRFYVSRCLDCGLPDPYRGDGDGIGSCECPRCYSCGAPPEGCDCSWSEDDWSEDWPDDDAGHGDNWIVMPRVETVTAFSEARLL